MIWELLPAKQVLNRKGTNDTVPTGWTQVRPVFFNSALYRFQLQFSLSVLREELIACAP